MNPYGRVEGADKTRSLPLPVLTTFMSVFIRG